MNPKNSTKKLLFWILSQTAKFNRRDFENLQKLFVELTVYQQTIKVLKYQELLQVINRFTDHENNVQRTEEINEIVQLYQAWKLLLESERIYIEVLKLEAFRHDINIDDNFKPSNQENITINFNKLSKTKAKKSKGRFFSSIKRNVFPNIKNMAFNDKVSIVDKHLDANLIEYFDTFVISCKKFSLVNSDESLLSDLLDANKKFYCDLFILEQKMRIVFKSLQDETKRLEQDSLYEKNCDHDLLSKLLQNWSVYSLIISGFIDSIKRINCKLQNDKIINYKPPRSKSFKKNSLERQVSFKNSELEQSECLIDYIQHEIIVNKMLVKNISDLIVQLSINEPRDCFGKILTELKHCLNIFRVRCNAHKKLSPQVDDYGDENVFMEQLELQDNGNIKEFDVGLEKLSFDSWENLKQFK